MDPLERVFLIAPHRFLNGFIPEIQCLPNVVDRKMRNWGKQTKNIPVRDSLCFFIMKLSLTTMVCTHEPKNMIHMSAGAKHGCRSLE